MREPRGTPRSGRSPEGPKSRSRAGGNYQRPLRGGGRIDRVRPGGRAKGERPANRTKRALSRAPRPRLCARTDPRARSGMPEGRSTNPRDAVHSRAGFSFSRRHAETPSHRRDPSSRNSPRRIVEAWVQISALRLPLSVGPSKVNEARLEVARRAAARTSARARDDGESPARESPAARVTRRARVATGDACASFASSDARCRIVSA